MFFKVLSIFLILSNILWTFLLADKQNIISFTNLKCTNVDPTFIKYTRCRLKAINRSLKTLNAQATYLKPPVNSAMVRFKILKRANGYKPFLIDVTFDACLVMTGTKMPVFKYFYHIMKPYTNMNSSCPLPNPSIVQNLPISGEKVPSTWPSGDYRVDVSLISGGVLRALVNIFVEIKEKF